MNQFPINDELEAKRFSITR